MHAEGHLNSRFYRAAEYLISLIQAADPGFCVMVSKMGFLGNHLALWACGMENCGCMVDVFGFIVDCRFGASFGDCRWFCGANKFVVGPRPSQNR